MIEIKRTLVLIAVLVAFGATSYFYVQGLSAEAAEFALSEAGPFEQLSLVFWALLSGYIIWRWWPGSKQTWLLAILPLFALAREASMHKAIYDISVLKVSFYGTPGIPVISKLIIGSTVLFMYAALLYGSYLLWKWLKAGAWRQTSGQFFIVGVALLVGTKILDRMNAILRVDFGVILPAHFAESVVVFEESLEMALPLVLLAAARYVWLENK